MRVGKRSMFWEMDNKRPEFSTTTQKNELRNSSIDKHVSFKYRLLSEETATSVCFWGIGVGIERG